MEIDPAALGKAIGRDYDKAQKIFRQALARQFVIGRQLFDIRQELGDKVFADWLAKFCPGIPLQAAEALIDYSLQSGLAQKVDGLLEADLD